MPPWAVGHSCFTFCCTTSHAAKWVPLVSQCSSSPSRTTSQHEVLGSSGPCISCSSMCIHCSSSSSYLNNLHTCAASRRALSIFTFSAVRKIHPTMQPQSTLPCPANGNSWPVTPFQCYLMSHPLPPSLHLGPHQEDQSYLLPQAMWWPLASSIHWSLRLLYLLCILLTMPVVLLLTLFAERRVGKTQAGKLEENWRNCMDCMFILSTLVQQPYSRYAVFSCG